MLSQFQYKSSRVKTFLALNLIRQNGWIKFCM